MMTHSATLTQDMNLTPLEAFPWLERSGPPASLAPNGRRALWSDGKCLVLYAGIAAAFAALYSGALALAGGPTVDLNRAGTLTGPSLALTPPTAAALPQQHAPEPATGAEAFAPPRQTPAAAEDLWGPKPSPVRMKPAAPARLPVGVPAPAPRIPVAPVAAEVSAAEPANGVTAPPPVPADRKMTPTTLNEFRSAIDAGKDAVRDVLSLANRQRPQRGASAEEMTRFRLRQQNAEAARSYRDYLDTLARSVRRANSESHARASLERVRQTLGYLATMRAASQASLP